MAAGPSIYDVSYLLGTLVAVIVPFLLGLIFNCIMGAIAVGMARKRGLRPVPAFFAAFFASFVALFFIAMTPKMPDNY